MELCFMRHFHVQQRLCSGSLTLAAAHLGEYCPGVGGHEAGDPDEADHLPGAAHTRPRVQCEGMADGLVPDTQI